MPGGWHRAKVPAGRGADSLDQPPPGAGKVLRSGDADIAGLPKPARQPVWIGGHRRSSSVVPRRPVHNARMQQL
jgi:hypothetical protein